MILYEKKHNKKEQQNCKITFFVSQKIYCIAFSNNNQIQQTMMMKFSTFVITAAAALLINNGVSAQTTVSGACPILSNPTTDTCKAIVSDSKFPSCCNASKQYCRCDGSGTLSCGADPSDSQSCSNVFAKENGEDGVDGVVVVAVVDESSGGNNNAAGTIALSIVAAASIIGVTVDLI
jgi:hypothetical protein